ncbi:MAG: hypothetical protein IKR68_01365 [Lachnospiraceae bacterium]|nr:hypothetical protein [Lachnospiraceae bacterium]
MKKGKIAHFFEEKDILTISVGLFIISRLMMFAMYVLLFKDFSFVNFLDKMNRFDSNHYARIALEGYSPVPDNSIGEAGWAFFPLYPMLVGLTVKLTSLRYETVAFIYGALMCIASAVVAGKYIRLTGGSEREAKIYAFLLIMGPQSFFLSIFYTEPAFLLLLTLCFYFLQKKQYIPMGICGALLSATRNLGVFFVFAVLAAWLTDLFRERKKDPGYTFSKHLKAALNDPSLVLGVFLIPSGLFSYMYFLYNRVGDAMAFVRVQKAWGRINGFFVKTYINALKDLTGYAAYHAVWVTLAFFLILFMIFKYKRFHEAVIALIILLMPMMSTMDSMARFILGGFVFYRTGAAILDSREGFFRRAVLVFLAGYALVMLNGWFYGEGVLT